MLNIKNKGITKTVIRQNGRTKTNKLKWEADYDGEVANISLDIYDDGAKQHYDSQLTNEDLSSMLNLPSVNKPIDERLINDFGIGDNETNQMIIEIDNLEPTFERQMQARNELIEPLRLTRHYTPLRIYNAQRYKKRPKTRRRPSSRYIKSTRGTKYKLTRRRGKRGLYVKM